MEAGGFEPPSRDVSRQASTCLVALLEIRFVNRQTTGSKLSYFDGFSPKPYRKTGSASLLCDALTKPAGKVGQDGPLIKQPFATVSCQLKFIAG
jgi:hypothetical protein